jgi:hypothetical protein
MDRPTPAADAFSRVFSNISDREAWERLAPGQKRPIIEGAINAAKQNGALSVLSKVSVNVICDYVMESSEESFYDVKSQAESILDGGDKTMARTYPCTFPVGGFEKMGAIHEILKSKKM